MDDRRFMRHHRLGREPNHRMRAARRNGAMRHHRVQSIEESVQLPHDTDADEWLALHTVEAFNEAYLIHGVIEDSCTPGRIRASVFDKSAQDAQENQRLTH